MLLFLCPKYHSPISLYRLLLPALPSSILAGCYSTVSVKATSLPFASSSVAFSQILAADTECACEEGAKNGNLEIVAHGARTNYEIFGQLARSTKYQIFSSIFYLARNLHVPTNLSLPGFDIEDQSLSKISVDRVAKSLSIPTEPPDTTLPSTADVRLGGYTCVCESVSVVRRFKNNRTLMNSPFI